MISDLMYFIISICCGSRQGRERRHIHDIIDDIEQLAEEEFEKLYHKSVSYTHLTLPTKRIV